MILSFKNQNFFTLESKFNVMDYGFKKGSMLKFVNFFSKRLN